MFRTTMYLNESEHEALHAEAKARGCSASELIREAIRPYLKSMDVLIAEKVRLTQRLAGIEKEINLRSGAQVAMQEIRILWKQYRTDSDPSDPQIMNWIEARRKDYPQIKHLNWREILEILDRSD